MKLVEKVRKSLIGIGALFINNVNKKIFAASISEPCLYGPPNFFSKPVLIILDIFRIAVIPLTLIIGMAMYFKKSKSSKKTKILTAIISIFIAIALYLIISYLYNMTLF